MPISAIDPRMGWVELAKGVGSMLKWKDAWLHSRISVGILVPLNTGHVTLDQVLDHSEPQVSQQQNGLIFIYFPGLMCSLETRCRTCIALGMVQRGSSMTLSCYFLEVIMVDAQSDGHLRRPLGLVMLRQCCHCW